MAMKIPATSNLGDDLQKIAFRHPELITLVHMFVRQLMDAYGIES